MDPIDDQGTLHAKRVAETWDGLWSQRRGAPSPHPVRKLARPGFEAVQALLGGYSLSQWILRVLLREFQSVQGKQIIEIGSGEGRISLELAKRGARVTLLDISSNALQIAQENFFEEGQPVHVIRGTIFSLPFQDHSFDYVWNAGVLEHFLKEQQIEALSEMMRICRPSGKVVTLNPSSRAGVYRWAKSLAEKKGRWDVGYEVPVASLKPAVRELNHGLSIREFSTGFLFQFHFLKYLFGNGALKSAYILTVEALNKLLMVLNHLPGYLLVTVLERR